MKKPLKFNFKKGQYEFIDKSYYELSLTHHQIVTELSVEIYDEQPNDLLGVIVEFGLMSFIACQKKDFDMEELRKLVKKDKSKNKIFKVILKNLSSSNKKRKTKNN